MGAVYDNARAEYLVEMNVLISVNDGEPMEGTLVAYPGTDDRSIKVYAKDGLHMAERHEMTWLDHDLFEAVCIDEDGKLMERFKVWTILA